MRGKKAPKKAQPQKRDPSRARSGKTQPQPRPTKVERIREIRRRILEGRWVKGHSEHEYAQECGVSERHVRLDAGEAQRRIAETIEEEDEIRAEVMGGLRMLNARNSELYDKALTKHQIRTAIEANRAKAEVYKLIIGVMGVEAPKKIDVGGSLGDLLAIADGRVGPEAPETVEE